MKAFRKQFHDRPMVYSTLGAVCAVVVFPIVPIWFIALFCALLIPITVFLFHRRNTSFLLTVTMLLMLVRLLFVPTELTEDGFVMSFLSNIRQGMKSSADILFRDEAALAKGMLLGDKSGIGAEQYALFSENGLLHIFAVSGLHVSLLTGALSVLVRSRNRALSLTLLSLFLLFFCAVTEFSSSVLRAAFMLIGIRISRIREKQIDMPSVFFFAMTLTLLCEPYSMYRTGFQLSFSAAWGMILFGEAFRKPFQKRIPNSKIISAVTSSAAATVGMLPIMAYHFEELAWIAIPLSVLLIPTMPIILLFGFFSILIYGMMPHLALLLSYPAYGAIKFIKIATELVNAPILHIPKPHPVLIAAYYIALLLCSKLYLRNARHKPWIGLAALMLTITVWFLIER